MPHEKQYQEFLSLHLVMWTPQCWNLSKWSCMHMHVVTPTTLYSEIASFPPQNNHIPSTHPLTHTQRTFNQHLLTLGLPPCYHYIVAGGDSALVKSVEATEDSWREGVRALEEVGGYMRREVCSGWRVGGFYVNFQVCHLCTCGPQTVQGKRAILFIGITCGLSVSDMNGVWVRRQLHLCMDTRHQPSHHFYYLDPPFHISSLLFPLFSNFSSPFPILFFFFFALSLLLLQAPFVAGQLDHCLQYRERYTPVLLGFNQEALWVCRAEVKG